MSRKQRLLIKNHESSHHSISRAIYASVPEDQDGNHIETFGLEFNHIFLKEDVDTQSNTVLSDNQFQAEFLRLGEQDIMLSNFGFHQTYIIGTGKKHNRSLRITQLDRIIGHDNLMLLSGEFHGRVVNDYHDIGELSNGKFTVLIEN